MARELPWEGDVQFPGFGSVFIERSPSSMIHAVLNGFFLPYRKGERTSSFDLSDRNGFVATVLRPDLAQFLETPIDYTSFPALVRSAVGAGSSPGSSGSGVGALLAPLAPDGKGEVKADASASIGTSSTAVSATSVPTVYQSLARGTLSELGKYRVPLSLKGLQETFESKLPLEGEVMVEILIRYLSINIFVLDARTQSVCNMGSIIPSQILPGHGAVVIIRVPNQNGYHYDLAALRTAKGDDHTFFKLDHRFIRHIMKVAPEP